MTSVHDGNPPVRRLLKWLSAAWEKFPWIVNAIGGVVVLAVGMLTAVDGVPGRNAATYVWVLSGCFGGALLILGPFLASRRSKRIKELSGEITELQERKRRTDTATERDKQALRETLDETGLELLQECGVNTDDTRISIYQHHRIDRQFVMVGRTSRNPKLNESGRVTYRDSTGLIAEAWEHEVYHNTERATDPEVWAVNQTRRFRMDINEARSIKMKSRSFLGVRIDDNNVHVGILVLESTDPKRITPDHAENIRAHGAFMRLQCMLRAAPKPPLNFVNGGS